MGEFRKNLEREGKFVQVGEEWNMASKQMCLVYL